jgi:hypothetical protein
MTSSAGIANAPHEEGRVKEKPGLLYPGQLSGSRADLRLLSPA